MTEPAESMSKKLDRISEIVIQGMRTADAPLWFLRGLGHIINSCPECGGDTGPVSENYDEEMYECTKCSHQFENTRRVPV